MRRFPETLAAAFIAEEASTVVISVETQIVVVASTAAALARTRKAEDKSIVLISVETSNAAAISTAITSEERSSVKGIFTAMKSKVT